MSKKKSISSSETTVNRKGKTVNAKKSKTAKNNRNKGRAFELECIKEIKHIFPDALRHLEFQKEEAIKGYDISNTDHYDIQCKRGHNYASVLKIEEVKRVMDRVPILLTRADNKKTIACLYFEDLITLLEDEKRSVDQGIELTKEKHRHDMSCDLPDMGVFKEVKHIKIKEGSLADGAVIPVGDVCVDDLV